MSVVTSPLSRPKLVCILYLYKSRKLLQDYPHYFEISPIIELLFTHENFNALVQLQKNIKNIPGVTEVLSIPSAYTITKDSIDEKFNATR